MLPTKREVEKHGNVRWILDYGIDPATGKRKRVTYGTEKEADAEIERLQNGAKKQGAWWTRLTEAKRQMISATCIAMEAAGQTIDGVWADWQRWRRENQQTVVDPMPDEDVVAEWERRKLAAGKSAKYVHDSRVTVLDKFGEGRARQPIHEISAGELERWIDARCKNPKLPYDALRTWGLSSKRTNTSLFSGLWEVAVAKGWASVNITEKFEPIGKISRHVQIHPNQTVINLMAGCLENRATFTRVLVVFVLGFFGCMRPEEVLSKKAIRNGLPWEKWFGWHDIDLRHGLIRVRTEIAKTGDERTIRLQPVAVEWLKFAKELGDEFPPVNERRLRVQVAQLIGFDMTEDGEDWERDGLRKNCATHLRAVYKNDYDVVRDMGHSVRILLKHYAELHTPESVSLDYWKISPKKIEEYRKTEAWRNLLIAVSATKPTPSASGTEASSVQPDAGQPQLHLIQDPLPA